MRRGLTCQNELVRVSVVRVVRSVAITLTAGLFGAWTQSAVASHAAPTSCGRVTVAEGNITLTAENIIPWRLNCRAARHVVVAFETRRLASQECATDAFAQFCLVAVSGQPWECWVAAESKGGCLTRAGSATRRIRFRTRESSSA